MQFSRRDTLKYLAAAAAFPAAGSGIAKWSSAGSAVGDGQGVDSDLSMMDLLCKIGAAPTARAAAITITNTVTGDHPNGFTVPAGEVWHAQGVVRTWKNIVVQGVLVMRAGDQLHFMGASA